MSDIKEIVRLGDEVETLIAPLRETLAAGERNSERLREQKAVQDEEIRKMKRILSAIVPSERKRAKAKPSEKASLRKVKKAEPFARRMMELAEEGQEHFTQTAMRKEMKSNPSTTHNIFNALRDIGFLRRAGKAPNSTAERWAILDEEAIDHALNEEKG